MRNLFSSRTRIAVAAAGVAVLLGGVTALAYWSTTGTGTGTASTGTPQVDTALTFSNNTLTAMFPGDSPQTLTVTVTNTGPQNAYVANVSAYLTVAGGIGSCDASDYLLGGSPASAASPVVPTALIWSATDLAKTSGTANATSTIRFNDTGSNQNGCQGATVTLHYAAS